VNPELHIVNHAELSARLKGQILAVCSDAYEEDFGPHLQLLSEATHLVAMHAGEVVSHAAWVKRPLRYGTRRRELSCAYIEAVATSVRWQRRGLGSLVMRAIPPFLGDFDVAALSPSKLSFYARCGWENWRGPLFYLKEGERISTPEETVMIYRLPRTPTDLNLHEELETDWRPGEVW
jgi:aminoglycoside 2'-N-acetyltransferase I